MVIVRIWGGLGNQLFQYAFCRRLEIEGKNVIIDCETYYRKTKEISRKYWLNIISNHVFVECNNVQRKKLSNNGTSLCSRILRTLNINKSSQYIERDSGSYDENVLNLDNVYLQGYWQTEKYFKSISSLIRNEIFFPQFEDNNLMNYSNSIKSNNSVCVHIRRGDYLSLPSKFGSVCNIDYYIKAINYIKEKQNNTFFYFFSDDIKWVKENIYLKNACYIESDLENEYNDLCLMSSCKHHIIANSSFSWWAAWLGYNENQIVIAPKVWNHCEKMVDIWCDGWIKM